MTSKPLPRFMLITHSPSFSGFEAMTQAMIETIHSHPPHTLLIHLREPSWSPQEVIALATVIKPHIQRAGHWLLINERIDIALHVGAQGVHLKSGSVTTEEARRIFKKGIIGHACHSVKEVQKWAQQGADYVTLSPIFETHSKPGQKPLGVTALKEAAPSQVAVFALGGMTPENMPSAKEAGAYGAAFMRSAWRQPFIGAIHSQWPSSSE